MPSSYRQTLFHILITGLMLLFPMFAQAGDADIESMMAAIEIRLGNEYAKQRAIEDGEDRALLCKYCHGSDGNSLKPDIPNLAGQNAKYLVEQINKFATKERDDFVMSELAEGFSTEDKINVAIFYSSQSVREQTTDKDKVEKGKILYHSACSSCHGIKGYGNQDMARLAGQQMVYTMNVIKTFRDNANNPDARKESGRKSAVMEAASKDLTDEQIETVAAYMAQMQ